MNRLTVLAVTISTGATVAIGASIVFAADNNDYEVPLTEWEQPDLRGLYNFSSNTPLERSGEYADREFLTPDEVRARDEAAAAASASSDGNSSVGNVGYYNEFWVEGSPLDLNLRSSIVIDPPSGRLPPRVEGAPVAFDSLGPDYDGERPVRLTVGGVGKDGPEDRGLSERCLVGFNAGPPFMPSMYNNNVQIFQNEDHVVIFNEMIHHARIVPLDDRPLVPEEVRRWMGDSRGYWDGDTLVIETRRFTDKTQTFAGTGIAEGKIMTERLTRVSDTDIEYQFTVDDSEAFQAPITGVFPLHRTAPDEIMYEYACHEGNYGMVNILQGQRVEDGTWDYDNNRARRNP